jgi:tetraacyldisaccharide 4'-kinase
MLAKICLAGIYRIAYKFHHLICLKPGKPLEHARLVVVGSHLAGGAGKTPFCAWLAENLHSGALAPACTEPSRPGPRIAILCHSAAADEAKMLREKLPFATVVTTSNRYRTAHELDRDFDFIICDDGFEDTRLTGATVIRLDRGDLPRHIRDLVPAGKYRSLAQDHAKPALALGPADVQHRISGIVNAAGSPCPALPIAVCGIGDPERFRKDLADYGTAPSKLIATPDHCKNFEKHLLQAIREGHHAVITEKDSTRLRNEIRQNPAVFVARQQTTVSGTAFQAISALFSK